MKLCPVLLNSEDNKKYLLVAGKLLTQQEALEQEIYIGYIDVAPLPEKAPITQMLVNYTHLTLSPTGEMDSILLLDKTQQEIPEEILTKAMEEAMKQESHIGVEITQTGGKYE